MRKLFRATSLRHARHWCRRVRRSRWLIVLLVLCLLTIVWRWLSDVSSRTKTIPDFLHNQFYEHPFTKYAFVVNPRHNDLLADGLTLPRLFVAGVSLSGIGLGNQMWMFASLYAIARSLNATPMIIPVPAIANTFKLESSVLDMGLFKDRAIIYRHESGCCKYDKKMTLPLTEGRPIRPSILLINGFLQSWRYFADYEDEIRAQFAFRDAISQMCDLKLRAILHSKKRDPMKTRLVGAHLRRNSGLGLNRPESDGTVGYLRRAIAYFRSTEQRQTDIVSELASDWLFIVSTDDVPWLHEHFWAEHGQDDADILLQPFGPPEVDLCVLARCNHSIVSTGTFGWWAAFLAGGVTTIQSERSNNLRYMRQFNARDFIPPNWVIL